MDTHPQQPNLDTIKAIKTLGNGALGTVFLAHDTSSPSSPPFAIKVIDTSKSTTTTTNPNAAHNRALHELTMLRSFPTTNPFLPTVLFSFKSNNLIGWALPYCSGGDLNQLRYQQTDHVFTTTAIRFYLAEIICALSHLHSMGIAYRDLKPENILIQPSGHVTLTDFDLSTHLSSHAKPPTSGPHHQVKNGKRLLTRLFSFGSEKVSPEIRRRSSFSGGKRSYSFVGTEEYVSPEVVKGEGHAYGVDWWALGVLAYEMLYGKTPFRGKSKKETFRNVAFKKPEFVGKRTALIDLIERLLEKDPEKRLGCFRGAEEIMEHEFFNGVKWDLLTEVLRPPFVPSMDEVDVLMEKLTPFDIREYFEKLREREKEKERDPPLSPSSPFNPVDSDDDDSLTDF